MIRTSARRRARLLAPLAWTACLLAVPSATPAAGRIEGTVRLTMATRASLASGSYAPRAVNRTSTQTGSVEDVVIFMRDVPAEAALPLSRTRIIQKDEAFEPRVVAITRGSTVDFPNADPYFHNVFSLSGGASFDLGRYKQGESRSRVFTKPGLVKVYCHVHSQMSASILVMGNDHFTRPGAGGSFTLTDIPAGTWRLSAWQERLGETLQSIRVVPGQTTRVEFNLPLVTE